MRNKVTKLGVFALTAIAMCSHDTREANSRLVAAPMIAPTEKITTSYTLFDSYVASGKPLQDVGTSVRPPPRGARPTDLHAHYTVIVTPDRDTIALIDPDVHHMCSKGKTAKEEKLGPVRLAYGFRKSGIEFLRPKNRPEIHVQLANDLYFLNSPSKKGFTRAVTAEYEAVRYNRDIHGPLTVSLNAMRQESPPFLPYVAYGPTP